MQVKAPWIEQNKVVGLSECTVKCISSLGQQIYCMSKF